MEAEIAAEISAEPGEVAPERRSTHRNRYRPRAWETRVGKIELLIPKKRPGRSYFPSFLEPRRRSEQAIIVGPLPGPRVSSVEHLMTPSTTPTAASRRSIVVARVSRPGATEIKQLRSAGWRLDINQTP